MKTCTCRQLPANPTSQDYNLRYLSILKCPVHKNVSDRETRKYEGPSGWGKAVTKKGTMRLPSKGVIYMPAFAVMQAVHLGRPPGGVGLKAYDSPSGWRACSMFPTREDARAYLLDVLDTVKREQKLGVRSKRNLDPTYEGGLDFRIVGAIIAVPEAPLRARKWKLGKK